MTNVVPGSEQPDPPASPDPGPSGPSAPTVPEPPTPPSQPQPEVPAPPHTGDAQVDGAIEGLLTVMSRPLEEQVEVYVGVHRTLQDRLADLDG